jgi:hypothetical protein
MKFAIGTVSHRPDILEINLLTSKVIQDRCCYVVAENPSNIPSELNMMINSMQSNGMGDHIFIFAHHDVVLPDSFVDDLDYAISKVGKDWGVMGVAGVRFKHPRGRIELGRIIDRGQEWGVGITEPIRVQTLDELLLVVNPASGLCFDPQFDFDFYGADICMQAQEKGLAVYAFHSVVHHNSERKIGGRTPGFFDCQEKFRNKWNKYLPIATTCAILK